MVVALMLPACAPAPLSPPVRSGEPIGVQLMRAEPAYVGTPFRVLLDFENADDTAFLAGAGGAKIDHEVAHTGGAALGVSGATHQATVKLSSLLPADNFPGTWTLVGAYLIAREPVTVTATYEVHEKTLLKRTVTLEPRKWTAVFLDVTALSDPNVDSGVKEVGQLRFEWPAGTDVWIDDVIVADNSRELVPDPEPAGSGWTVRQRGFETTIERQGMFRLALATPEKDAVNGWRVAEASELRVRLVSGDGKHARTIYADGREYADGKFAAVAPLPTPQRQAFEAQHANPAEIVVNPEMGRLERNTPGDRNNDGYNELWGSYEVHANGPRLELRIEPHTPKLVGPVLEVANLPKGKAIVNVDGQVAERIARLPNGNLLVQLPGAIERPVTVNVNVRAQ